MAELDRSLFIGSSKEVNCCGGPRLATNYTKDCEPRVGIKTYSPLAFLRLLISTTSLRDQTLLI
jgi:hypothetical protein